MEPNYTLAGAKTDVFKLLLSFFIVALHTQLLPEYCIPLLRLAVPLFFIISSYFFWNKINKSNDSQSRNHMLKSFVKRNFKLYIFWTIILFPVVFIVRGFLSTPLSQLTWYSLYTFFWGGTFQASWFIIALVYGIVIIYILAKYLKNKWLFILSLFFYLICCLNTNYYEMFHFHNVFIEYLCPENSLFVSLIWITIGKVLSEKEVHISLSKISSVVVISLICLYIEYFIIQSFNISRANDCYLSLIFTSLSISIWLQKVQISLKNGFSYRQLSTVVYCFHYSLFTVILFINSHLHIDASIVFLRLLVFPLCILLYIILRKCAEKFSILKNAY